MGRSRRPTSTPSRSRSTRASPTPPPSAVVHAAAQLERSGHGGGDRPAHRVPAGLRRGHDRRPAAPRDRQPGDRTVGAGDASTPSSIPAATTSPVAESIPIRRLDDDGLAALNAERIDGPRPRGAAGHPRPLRRARPRTRPTSSWRRSPRRGASTAPTRRSGAAITVDGRPITPLLRQLRDATERIGAKFVRSAFVGNAGIVSFLDGATLALKAETHNHPSAVEPFGGANTGVGGVIRDVLGAGHRPIAVTDVLCFGPADLAPEPVPEGTLHPRRIRQGVVDGVADYGNKIGLPTVAGAVLYDHEFTTNPLVFCGCIGAAPDVEPPTGPYPGDRVVVIGGAHRPRRHPRGDVLQRGDGRDHRRGGRSERADRRPGDGEAADRRARRGRATCGRRSPTAAPAVSRRRSARWLRASVPTSSSPPCRSSIPASSRGRSGCPRRRSGWSSPSTRPTSTSCARRCATSPRRAQRHRHVHRGRPPRRPLRRRSRPRPRHASSSTTAARSDAMTATAPAARLASPTGRHVDDPASDAARPARPPEHRLEGGDRPSLRPRDPRRDAGAPARRRRRPGPCRRRRARPSGGRRRGGDRHRRQPVVRPARSRADGRRRRRRGDPQRRRRRRRPRARRPARQLLVG